MGICKYAWENTKVQRIARGRYRVFLSIFFIIIWKNFQGDCYRSVQSATTHQRERVYFLFIGRANTGKSSLFNAVIGRKNLLMTSKRAVSQAKIRKNTALINKSFSQGPYTSIGLLQCRRSRKARSSRCTRIWHSWKGSVGRNFQRIYWNPQTVCISPPTSFRSTKRYLFSFFLN